MAQSLASSFLASTAVTPALSVSPPAKAKQSPASLSSRLLCRASAKENECASGRREALLALGATASALVLPPASPYLGTDAALAADLNQRIQRGKFLDKLKLALAGPVERNQDLIPGLLRLVINDAITYDKETKTGGANGSIRFAEELKRPENAGLEPALKLLETVKAEVDEGALGGPVSYADLITFGGSAALKRVFINDAVAKAGGDYEKGVDLYRAIGSAGQWGAFDKQFGRPDATEADPAGRVPIWGEASTAELTAVFAPFGLKPRQITVLAIFLSDNLEAFEDKLAADPEYAPWVTKYRKSRGTTSQTDYQVDLITAFSKLSVLGTRLNFEAYTFIPDRPKFKF